jgi:hypothetical protein
VFSVSSLSHILSAMSCCHIFQRNVKSVSLESQYTQLYELKAGKEIIFFFFYSLILYNNAFTNKDRKGKKAAVHIINISNHDSLTLYTSHLLVNLLFCVHFFWYYQDYKSVPNRSNVEQFISSVCHFLLHSQQPESTLRFLINGQHSTKEEDSVTLQFGINAMYSNTSIR